MPQLTTMTDLILENRLRDLRDYIHPGNGARLENLTGSRRNNDPQGPGSDSTGVGASPDIPYSVLGHRLGGGLSLRPDFAQQASSVMAQ